MVNYEVDAGDPIPGAGPTSKQGRVIAVSFGPIAASTQLVGPACDLMGYSICEATGLAGAAVELLNGGDDNAGVIAALSLNGATDATTVQTPQASTQQGANVALAASIGGIPGLVTIVQTIRIVGLGATAATEVQATLTGVQGGTITYPVNVPAGVAVPITPVVDSWGGRGLVGNAVGATVTLNLPAFGAGNTFAEVEIQGYATIGAGIDRTQWYGPDGVFAEGGVHLRVIFGTVRGAVYMRR